MVDIGIVPAAGAVTVAGHTIRRITRLLVVRVSGAIVIGKMAGNAGRGKARILAGRVTIRAGRQLVFSLELERVLKDGPFPAQHAVVADLALGGEPGRHMVGLFRGFIAFFMARVTFDRRLPQALISVALSAILHPVRAFELEPGHSGVVPF